MGLAKYFEDNYEIFLERIEQNKKHKISYIEMSRSTKISNKLVPNGVKVAPKEKNENKDKKLHCRDCGKEFVFSIGEQRFYEMKGFHQPKRCKSCREIHKIRQSFNRGEAR